MTSPVRMAFVNLYFDGEMYPLIDRETSQGVVQNPLYLLNFSVQVNTWVGAGNTYSIAIRDPQADFLEILCLLHRDKFGVEFGWRSVSGEVSSAYHALLILDWDVLYHPTQGNLVTIRASDVMYKLNLKSSLKQRDPKALISQEISRIFQENEIPAEVEPTSNLVGDEKSLQAGMSDMEYLQSLVKAARSATDGRNDYTILSLTRNRRPFILVTSDRPRKSVYRTYVYGREREGEIIALASTYAGLETVALGAAFTSAVHIDPVTKAVTNLQTSHLEDASYERFFHYDPQGQPSRIWTVPYRTITDSVAYLQGRRYAADKLTYLLNFSIIGDPGVLPFDVVNVFLLKPPTSAALPLREGEADLHFQSGAYQVFQVQHTIVEGRFVTDLQTHRQAGKYGTVQGQKLVVVSQDVSRSSDSVDRTVQPLEE